MAYLLDARSHQPPGMWLLTAGPSPSGQKARAGVAEMPTGLRSAGPRFTPKLML